METALSVTIGLGMVFGGGVAYYSWYKQRVLEKIDLAFQPGYDPALEVASHAYSRPHNKKRSPEGTDGEADDQPSKHIDRPGKKKIKSIINGEEVGHYYVILGPKGVGKGTMIFDCMHEIKADGVSICEAHPDLEVFRLRLGKALNFEYNEDSQTGVFQRRDPREGGPALDIERALNKLEKVALKAAKRRGKPYVLIFNNVHLFNNDDDGKNMLLQLQQKAEAWSAGGIMTIVFTTDDSWPYFTLRKTASRMHTISIYDLTEHAAIDAAHYFRADARRPSATLEEAKEVVRIVGGRLSYIIKAARSEDIINTAQQMLKIETEWLRSQIGLIPDCDDDVMDEQKWSSCSWLLLQEFVKIHKQEIEDREAKIASGEATIENPPEIRLPAIPYWKCRVIMTRTDFLEELDRLNIINIDINHEVRPDSMLILHAAQQVCEEEGFEELLASVRDRIDEIESLHRTRELTFKDVDKGDRIRLTVDKGGARLVEDS